LVENADESEYNKIVIVYPEITMEDCEMDFGSMMKFVGAWNSFKTNHPKFPAFCKAVADKGLKEDSVIEIIVTTPENERIETSLKIKASDLELLQSFGGFGGFGQ
jgi:hypothetical protein